MILKEKYILSNGIKIPKLGLGTWFLVGESATYTVNEAINIGYRHIDSAQAYQNEYAVGKGIKSSKVNRNDIKNIINNCTIKPMANQVLAHIGNMPFEIIEYMKSQNILVEAYSPIAHAMLVNNENVKTFLKNIMYLLLIYL